MAIDWSKLKGSSRIAGDNDPHAFQVLFAAEDGLDRLMKEVRSKAPITYSVRSKLNFFKLLPESAGFEREHDFKHRKLLHNLYCVESNVKPSLLLRLANELEKLDYVNFAAICPLPKQKHINMENASQQSDDGEPTQKANLCYDSRIKNFVDNQYYLAPSTDDNVGLNVLNAWQKEDGSKSVVRVMDHGIFEHHFNFENSKLKVVSNGAGEDSCQHGTATSGLVVANRADDLGLKGIAHNCNFYFYNADSKAQILMDANPGDVVYLPFEIHVGSVDRAPVVANATYWVVCNLLVQDGIVVLFAAGNGNLDVLNDKKLPQFGDSGAIMCCACDNVTGKRESHSNYNYYRCLNAVSRVFTTGYGSYLNVSYPNEQWTANFPGTSAATAILAGCAALANSFAYKTSYRYLNTHDMHKLFTKVGVDVDKDFNIGARPNVDAALTEIKRKFDESDPWYVISGDKDFHKLHKSENVVFEKLSEKYTKFEIQLSADKHYQIYLNGAPEGTIMRSLVSAPNAICKLYGWTYFDEMSPTLNSTKNKKIAYQVVDGAWVEISFDDTLSLGNDGNDDSDVEADKNPEKDADNDTQQPPMPPIVEENDQSGAAV